MVAIFRVNGEAWRSDRGCRQRERRRSDGGRLVECPMLVVARTQPRVEREMRMFLKQNTPGILALPFVRSPNIPVPKLSDFKVPTLVMVGDRDVPEIVQRAHLISREIPGAKEVVIKDADHMVNLEKPREFNRALASFLRGLK
jgi:pimeloyl-ACP methyl ester carboxylesterase